MNCYEVHIKFQDQTMQVMTHVEACNEHDAFRKAVSEQMREHDHRIVESYHARDLGITYQDFLKERNARHYD